MKKITILGRIPSKKNSRTIVCFGKTPRSLPSSKYNSWHKEASAQLCDVNKIKSGSDLKLVFYFPDNRRADLTNKAESVMDLLVDNKIIEDDSWQVIKSVTLESAGVDKENPRVEIYY